jgi:hypothetical protein
MPTSVGMTMRRGRKVPVTAGWYQVTTFVTSSGGCNTSRS